MTNQGFYMKQYFVQVLSVLMVLLVLQYHKNRDKYIEVLIKSCSFINSIQQTGMRADRESHSDYRSNQDDGDIHNRGRSRVNLTDQYSHILDENQLRTTQRYQSGRINFMYNPPYPIQLDYMNFVLQCLDDGQNCFVEAPTGTGKTLCLLNSVFSWLTSLKKRKPSLYEKLHEKTFDRIRIIYTSRTHTQLQQIKKELQKTCYRPNMVVYGGRKKMCCSQKINLQMQQDQIYKKCTQFAKNKRTLAKIKKMTSKQKVKHKITLEYELQLQENSCKYFHEYAERKQKGQFIFDKYLSQRCISINDEREACKNNDTCPYYYPGTVKYKADLILMPYTYILNKSIFKRSEGLIKNSIIIFDEGHNIAECAREGITLTLTQSDLISVEKQLQNHIKKVNKGYDQIEPRPDDQNGGSDEQEEEKIKQQLKQKDKPKIVLKISKQEKQKQENPQKQKNEKYKSQDKEKQKQQEKQNRNLIKLMTKCKDEIINYRQKFQKFQQENIEQSNNRGEVYEIQRGQQGEGISKKIIQILYSKRPNQIEQIHVQQLRAHMYSISQDLQKIFQLIVRLTERKVFPMPISKFADKLEQISEIIKTPQRLFDYGLFLQWQDIEDEKKKKQTKLLIKLYCYNPKLMFQLLKQANPYALIVTSGTLSPYNTWKYQTGLDFKSLVNNKQHVVSPSQCVTRFLPSYGKQWNAYYSVSLQKGTIPNLQKSCRRAMEIITQISKKTPGGILVILSSNAWRKQIQKIYKNYPIKQKPFFQKKGDPQFKDLQKFKEKYKGLCEQKQGAILFAICRGQVTQGIDFVDNLCRAVIVVGYPCPDLKNPYLVGRMDYINRLELPGFNANVWMETQIMRAVNQGIGRAIRHKDDYGMIFLLDCRYKFPANLAKIAGWALRDPQSRSIKDFETIQGICEKFFTQQKKVYDRKMLQRN